MATTLTDLNTLPTPEQVEAHLRAHPPRRPSRALLLLPLVVLAAAFGLTLVASHPALLVLPWALLAGLVVWLNVRARRTRRREAEANGVQEAAMLRRHEEALRGAWRLLPKVVDAPDLHGRMVGLIGHSLDALNMPESAVAAYTYLIERLPGAGEHPMAAQLQVQRAIAQLRADRLLDADDALRRLRQTMDAYAGTPIGAAYRLAVLFQQVRTHHDAEAAAESAALLEALRPLGVDAGYGHALLALAHHRLGSDEAKTWWERATLLLPAALLLTKFGELEPLAELPVTPWPVRRETAGGVA